MNLSIPKTELTKYVSNQLNVFFPDTLLVKTELNLVIDLVLDRLNYCFKFASNPRYCGLEGTLFNHLYSDHYVMFLWFLSNTVFENLGDKQLASKIYYLNKSLHGVDCMYDTKMPDIFLIFHGVGTMLGKAHYDDYFVVLQGCTVGSHNGSYPRFGKGVALAANSSVIGGSNFGNRSTVGTRTTVFQKNIPDDNTVFINFDTGALTLKSSNQCYAQQFYNIDLKKI